MECCFYRFEIYFERKGIDDLHKMKGVARWPRQFSTIQGCGVSYGKPRGDEKWFVCLRLTKGRGMYK